MKNIIVYFANWNLNKKPADHGGEVASIPWNYVTGINHAFWAVAPLTDPEMTSFERRALGLKPREEFTISSMNPENDLSNLEPSLVNTSLQKNHFCQYKFFKSKYPNVTIMLSIGGWARCGYFSEMASTQKGRQSFIKSCVSFLEKYSFFSGIDIDWEYPGCTTNGERKPDENSLDNDEGCPIWESKEADSKNFALLLKEMRESFDNKFGKGIKKISACAGASVTTTLPCQNWEIISKNLDIINIMTYDLCGVWDGVTGHATSLFGAKEAVRYLLKQNIPINKLCIGSPLYAVSFKVVNADTSFPLGAKCHNLTPADSIICQDECKEFSKNLVVNRKKDKGFKKFNDLLLGATYLYNDDPKSKYYGWFLSYEDENTLKRKLDFINFSGLAGIIVWESSQDTKNYDFLKQMSKGLA